MTKEDARTIDHYLRAMYPAAYSKIPEDDVAGVWFDWFTEKDPRIVMAALKEYIRYEVPNYPPTPADIESLVDSSDEVLIRPDKNILNRIFDHEIRRRPFEDDQWEHNYYWNSDTDEHTDYYEIKFELDTEAFLQLKSRGHIWGWNGHRWQTTPAELISGADLLNETKRRRLLKLDRITEIATEECKKTEMIESKKDAVMNFFEKYKRMLPLKLQNEPRWQIYIPPFDDDDEQTEKIIDSGSR